jgi:Domain of unknown function (DUF2017)
VSGGAGGDSPDGDAAAGGVPDEEGATGAFRRTRGGVSARFSTPQVVILRSLVSQLAELMEETAAEPGLAGQAGLWQEPSWPEPPTAGSSGRDQAGQAPAGRSGGPGEPPPSLEDLAAMLGGTGPASPPEDPVLARLLPDAYRDDPEAAGEFRRYTEQSLRSAKVAAARTVLATLPEHGGRVRLGPEEAQAWLRSLNDVRLAVGTALGITEDYEDELEAAAWADPRSAYLGAYHWLGSVQDSLVRALP